MTKLVRRKVEIMGCVCGIVFSLMYINPYEKIISLSEAVLQLSGSYGMYRMGFSISQLVSFFVKLLPAFLMEMYGGVWLYRHFCTASVFVFSRETNRSKWYCGECLHLGMQCLSFMGSYLVSALVVAFLRFHVLIDFDGIRYVLIHWMIYSVFILFTSIFISTLSIYLGSSEAYTAGMTIQVLEIVILNIMYRMTEVFTCFSYDKLFIWNPISYLVIAWQYGENKIFEPIYFFAIPLPIFIIIFLVGMWIVIKSDIIVIDSEWGK